LLSGDRHLCTPTITPTHSRTPALWEKPPPISQRAPQQAAENGARSFEYEALLLSLMQKNAGPKNPPGGPLPYRAPLNPYPVNWVERQKEKNQAPSQVSETHT